MSDKYILAEDGRTPIKCNDLMTWARSFENGEVGRRVKRETIGDGVEVSTVFLAIDHQFGDGPPLLWETMIFGGPHDSYQDRYSTYDDAVVGHEKAKRIALGSGEASK